MAHKHDFLNITFYFYCNNQNNNWKTSFFKLTSHSDLFVIYQKQNQKQIYGVVG